MISHPLQVLAHSSPEGLPTRKVIKGIQLLVVGQHYRLPYPSTRLDLIVERDSEGSLDICLELLRDFNIWELRRLTPSHSQSESTSNLTIAYIQR
jgi:hypothetical protein